MAWTYSGFWRRFAAFAIDCILLGVGIAVVLMVARVQPTDPRFRWVSLLAPWLYFAWLESSAQQATLGKRAVGIKVTDVAGHRIGFGRATGRYFGKILSSVTLFVGYVLAVFTSRRQALHDLIADTLVVRRSLVPEEIASAEPAPRLGGPAIAAVIVLGTLFNPFGLGIVAGIAIPAYQSYTNRAQVAETLTVAEPYKSAITQALAKGVDPETLDRASLSLSAAPAGARYVRNINVQSGVITIEFGRQANALIRGKSLLLIPGKDSAGHVVWICGRAAAPPNVHMVLEDMQDETTVPPQWLPPACRR
jgi:uncharacterized RDD family membrane protein YckC/Tfp pilus assembly major pilin PilA